LRARLRRFAGAYNRPHAAAAEQWPRSVRNYARRPVMRPVEIAGRRCGGGSPLLWIAGPCVIESGEQTLAIAERLAALAQTMGLQLVFKASFDKANRSSGKSFRGPG